MTGDVRTVNEDVPIERAYDELTGACNACHVASDRGALVIQRPTSPPLTNLRFTPSGFRP